MRSTMSTLLQTRDGATLPSLVPPTGAAPIEVMFGPDPLRIGRRHCLHGLNIVDIGRASAAGPLWHDRYDDQLSLAYPDPFLSAVHARLERAGGAWRIEDRGSRNGTFVNGVRRAGERLRDGDMLVLGGTTFVFRNDVATAHDCSHEAFDPVATAPHPQLASHHSRLAAHLDCIRR